MDATANFAYSTVATAPVPAGVGLTLDVAAGEGARFPAVPFNATVWPAGTLPIPTNATIIRVTLIVGDTLTFTRLAEGAANRDILVTDQIAATITAGLLAQLVPYVGATADLDLGVHSLTAASVLVNTTTHATGSVFTQVGDRAVLNEGRVIGAPPGLLTLADVGAGNVTGVVQYAYTESDGVGETTLSPAATINVVNKIVRVTFAERQRRGTSQRRLYRTEAGGAVFKLVHEFDGGNEYFQSVWDDNVLDAALGVVAPGADTTRLFTLDLTKTVKTLRTHPDVAGNPGDLTVLTSDGGGAGGVLAIDAYGPLYSRVTSSGNAFGSLYTQNADGTFPGRHIFCQWLSERSDGSVPTTVFRVNARGNVAISPLTLSDAATGDGATTALACNATFPAVSTVANNANLFITIGAGNSAFDQRGVASIFGAGYTGTKNTFALYGSNQTASGTSYGVYGTASGAAALSVGVCGFTSTGTIQVGVVGVVNNFDPSTLAFPAGVTYFGGAFSNGTSVGDILIGFDNTTAVFRVQDGGDVLIQNVGATTVLNVKSTGGGSGISRATATSFDLGSVNNVPVFFYANNINHWKILTTGALIATIDNTINIGAVGATRPATGYFGTSVVAPLLTASTTLQVRTVANGVAALTRTMAGCELIARGMNATSAKYAPAIKFMSEDTDLVTENPKFLAAIIGRATETYDGDTKGGMALDFATTPNTPGVASVPTVRMTLDQDGSVILTVSLGVTGTRVPAGWFTDLTVTNAIAGSITGNAATVTVANEAADTTCFLLFSTAASGSLGPKTNTALTVNASTGAVGLGSTTVTGILTVNANGATTAAGVFTDASNTGRAGTYLLNDAGDKGGSLTCYGSGFGAVSQLGVTVANNLFLFSISGSELVIGTLGGQALTLGTGNAARVVVGAAGAIQFTAYGAGALTTDASGNITAVSDERFKIIRGAFAPGLAELLQITPIRYQYALDSGLDLDNTYAGFSAQEVLQWIPEAVGKDPQGFYTLGDRPIIAALVNAMKTLSAELDGLRSALHLPIVPHPAEKVLHEDRIIVSRRAPVRPPPVGVLEAV